MRESESKIIIHAFTQDGVLYPPVCAECQICVNSEEKVVGVGFMGDETALKCDFKQQFINPEGWCRKFNLDQTKLSSQQLYEYLHVRTKGELGKKACKLFDKTNEDLE
jgi:hypothetical protein